MQKFLIPKGLKIFEASMEFVFPNGNEKGFIDIALKLCIKKICFLYDSHEYIIKKKQGKQAVGADLSRDGLGVEIGLLVKSNDIGVASTHCKFLAAKSSDNDRALIEGKKIRLIYGFEESARRDYMHQRASGLNHVLCELCSRNNVAVGISYGMLLNADSESCCVLMGRIMQNIRLCQKYKVKIVVGSFSGNPFDLRSPHDLRSLLANLGMQQRQARECFAN